MNSAAMARSGWRLSDALAARRIDVPTLSPRRQMVAQQAGEGHAGECVAVVAFALAVARLTGQRNVAIRDLDAAGDDMPHGGGSNGTALRFDLHDDVTLGALHAQVSTAGANCATACAEVAVARTAWAAHQALAADDAPLAVLLLDAGGSALLTAPECLDAVAAECLRAAIEQGIRVAAGPADCRLGAVSVLSACARANLLCRFQNGHQPEQPQQPLLARLAEIVQANPSAILLQQGHCQVDASELWQRSGHAAASLRARGFGPGCRIALSGPRSIEHVLALLAVLRAGGEAILLGCHGAMAVPADVDALVVHGTVTRSLPEAEAIAFAALEEGAADADVLEDADCASIVCAAIARPVVLSPDAVASAIHGLHELQAGSGQRTLWWSQPGHPAALLEIFSPLLQGACCVIPESPSTTLETLADSLRNDAIDIAVLPGDLVERAQHLDSGLFSGLRELLVRGDVPAAVLRRLQHALPRLRLSGIHGGDGCPLAALTVIPRPLPAAWRRVPIGVPLPGVRIHVLAPDGGLLPIGAVGELHVGGCGVAIGEPCEGRELIISRRFVCDPYGSPGQRLFRSGERGRRLPDGSIERIDPHRPPVSARAAGRRQPIEFITHATWLPAQPDGDPQQGREMAG
jgi:nonribosomal peptide synthetase DhbF